MHTAEVTSSGPPNDGGSVNLHSMGMSSKTFDRLRQFIYEECGICITESKKLLLEGRILRRLRQLEILSFDEYCEYLFSPAGMNTELGQMIDAITTNKTDFMREPDHFEYLVKTALPELMGARKEKVGKTFRFWSAGCSTGEEPYTLAIYLSEYAEKCAGFKFSILATDISMRVLEKAWAGIYEDHLISPIPMALRNKYFLKSKHPDKKVVRIVPELRNTIQFRRLNLMDGDFRIPEPIDVIFCRNVIIYFDKPIQESLFRKFHRHVCMGGYLFVGHSETLHGLNVPFDYTAATIYRKLR